MRRFIGMICRIIRKKGWEREMGWGWEGKSVAGQMCMYSLYDFPFSQTCYALAGIADNAQRSFVLPTFLYCSFDDTMEQDATNADALATAQVVIPTRNEPYQVLFSRTSRPIFSRSRTF